MAREVTKVCERCGGRYRGRPSRKFCSLSCVRRGQAPPNKIKDQDPLDHWRFKARLRKHGITREEYKEMLESQGYACAICGMPEKARSMNGSGEAKRLAFDHDHRTGKLRGLLCQECNIGIGNFEDDPDLLMLAVRYLGG